MIIEVVGGIIVFTDKKTLFRAKNPSVSVVEAGKSKT
jgi:hypothetical protein